jgi:hypothetical protein
MIRFTTTGFLEIIIWLRLNCSDTNNRGHITWVVRLHGLDRRKASVVANVKHLNGTVKGIYIVKIFAVAA